MEEKKILIVGIMKQWWNLKIHFTADFQTNFRYIRCVYWTPLYLK